MPKRESKAISTKKRTKHFRQKKFDS